MPSLFPAYPLVPSRQPDVVIDDQHAPALLSCIQAVVDDVTVPVHSS